MKRNRLKILGVVENDPNIDYEYYENRDFSIDYDIAEKKGELFRGYELGGSNFWESAHNADAIIAAKRAGVKEGPIAVPYPPCPAALSYPNRPPRPHALSASTGKSSAPRAKKARKSTAKPYPLPHELASIGELCMAEPEAVYRP